MSTAEAIRDFVHALLPAGWHIQSGQWQDGARGDRFVVIRPSGGPSAELVRRPNFTLSVIGAFNESDEVAAEAANAIVEATRTQSGGLVQLLAAEPTYMPTNDGRPVYQFALEAITT